MVLAAGNTTEIIRDDYREEAIAYINAYPEDLAY